MHFLPKLFLLFFLTCNLFATEKMEFVVGLIDEEYNEYKFADAEIALKRWIRKISKIENINVTMKIFDTYEDYNKAVLADEVQNIILSPELYLRHSESLKKTHYDGWIKEANNQFFAYNLIGDKELYKEKRYLRASYFKDDLIAKIILEKIAFRDNKVFTYRMLNKESKAVIDTFFNKSDVALVGSKVWKINSELNPQVGRKLQIIDTTDAIFMKMFSLISKKMPPLIKKNYFEALSRLNESADGKQMMRMFKFNNVYPITIDDLADLENFYEDYRIIKKKRK